VYDKDIKSGGVSMAILEIFEKAKKQRKAKEQKKALKNVAVGAAIGATVGAVAGVLLAPKPGKETREDIAKAAQEAVDKAKIKLEEVKEKAGEVVEEVKGKVKLKMEKIENCHCGCEDIVAAPTADGEKK
jgi:hypothetical protein